MVVLEQSGSIWARVSALGKGGCNRAKLVFFVQSGCVRDKAVVFEQKWL